MWSSDNQGREAEGRWVVYKHMAVTQDVERDCGSGATRRGWITSQMKKRFYTEVVEEQSGSGTGKLHECPPR